MAHHTESGFIEGRRTAKLSRRHFTRLLPATLALAAAGVGPEHLTAAAARPAQSLNSRYFTSLVGSSFHTVSPSGEQSAIRLLAVDILARGARNNPPTEYSRLRFSSQGTGLPEGLYELTHPAAGRFLLHLQPGAGRRSIAHLSQVSAEYLASVSIPRKQPVQSKLPLPVPSEAAA